MQPSNFPMPSQGTGDRALLPAATSLPADMCAENRRRGREKSPPWQEYTRSFADGRRQTAKSAKPSDVGWGLLGDPSRNDKDDDKRRRRPSRTDIGPRRGNEAAGRGRHTAELTGGDRIPQRVVGSSRLRGQRGWADDLLPSLPKIADPTAASIHT